MSLTDAPIAIINELLELPGLPIKISIHENEQILAKKLGSEEYSIVHWVFSDSSRDPGGVDLIAALVLGNE